MSNPDVKDEAGDRAMLKAAALAEFTEYFVRNYPGPHTVIGDPRWHAPKIFGAVFHAIAALSFDAKDERIAEPATGVIALQQQLAVEIATVDRVWAALGISTYQQAGGKEISEIVADWKARAEAAESQLRLSGTEDAGVRALVDALQRIEEGMSHIRAPHRMTAARALAHNTLLSNPITRRT